MQPIFFYGSLRDHALMEIVLDRPVAPEEMAPARAVGFATRRAEGEAYPILVPAPGAEADGVLLISPTDGDLDRLAYFEEAEYALAPIDVEGPDGPMQARYFRGTEKTPALERGWDFSHWHAHDRATALEAARELMALFGRVAVEDIDDHWIGIMNRARQKARAKAEPGPVPGGLRTVFGAADTDVRSHRRTYSSYLGIEEIELRHRRFDGGWSAPLARSVALWGDAVTLLPYDPVRDRVLLIEQFRAAAMARGDRCPWCIEVVAGRVDADETPDAVARREAAEEAGLELGRLMATGQYYSTPGMTGEVLYGFIGEADLPHSGGLHGLAREHEDIRTVVLDFADAMAAAARGEVNTGPALVALLWLSAHRDELRKAWRAA